MRLNKYVAKTGLCNRREAEVLVKAGRVQVNGEVITNPGHDVNGEDEVMVDQKPVVREVEPLTLVFNKPPGLSLHDVQSDEWSNFPKLATMIRDYELQPIIDLQPSTAGLVILTNDKTIVTGFQSKQIKLSALFEIQLMKNPDEDLLSMLQQKLLYDHEAKIYKRINIIKTSHKVPSIGIEMYQSDDVRLMADLAGLGLPIKLMDRLTLGPLSKRNLPRKRQRQLKDQELIFIKHLSNG